MVGCHTVTVMDGKYQCGEVFRVDLAFRRFYRKKVQVTSEYFVKGKNKKREMLIKDISMTKINFETLKPHNISRNDAVKLKFSLDNPNKTELHTLVKIRIR